MVQFILVGGPSCRQQLTVNQLRSRDRDLGLAYWLLQGLVPRLLSGPETSGLRGRYSHVVPTCSPEGRVALRPFITAIITQVQNRKQ